MAAGFAGIASRGWVKGAVPVADAFDREVETFMKARGIPGGALAVVKDRRLVYARGYGLADRDRSLAVRPDSLFRIASLSKPITGVAVMKLIEDGKLTLDQRAFEVLRLDPPPGGDARLREITIRLKLCAFFV